MEVKSKGLSLNCCHKRYLLRLHRWSSTDGSKRIHRFTRAFITLYGSEKVCLNQAKSLKNYSLTVLYRVTNTSTNTFTPSTIVWAMRYISMQSAGVRLGPHLRTLVGSRPVSAYVEVALAAELFCIRRRWSC